ncbi:hypothetical protein Tco_1155785 [Tanacetum coccineum]
MPGCSWRGHLRGVHIHYCPGVLGRETCEGYIFITVRMFLEGHLRNAAENASLRARIKTTEAIEKITRNHERQARVKIEQQLVAVQES